MKAHVLEQIVNAVLYEGHILYPYRPAAKKVGREKFAFGRVYPKAYSDMRRNAEPWMMQTECLVQPCGKDPSVEVAVRFLHTTWREIGRLTGDETAPLRVLPALTVNGTLYQTWQEAAEREIVTTLDLSNPSPRKVNSPFAFGAARSVEPLTSEQSPGPGMMRRHESLEGTVETEIQPLASDLFKISVRIFNRTPITSQQCNDEDAVLMRTFGSTHMVLHAASARFVSMMDPPAKLARAAGQCKNIGAWPVLIGEENKGDRDLMLSSPIVLYDYPHITPESSGSFFEGNEIDEMLSLRVMTMNEAEKLTHSEPPPRGSQPEEIFFNPTTPLRTVFTHGRQLRAGSGVRIHPKARGGSNDNKLEGKEAFIEAIEQDAEGHVHLALVVENGDPISPGAKQKPGHRFFYSIDEVEPLENSRS